VLENVQINPDRTAGNAPANVVESHRIAMLKRSLVKLLRLRGRPSLAQTEALDTAARMAWLAERAALDPDARLDHIVRIANAARRAELRLRDLATERKSLSLRDYLAAKAGDS
jgi:hypothetical protein